MMEFLNPLWPLLADAAVKGMMLLLLACAAAIFLRRRPAALRHLIWSLAFTGLLAMPLLSAIMPQWQILPRFSVQRPVAAQQVSPSDTKTQTPGLSPAVPVPIPQTDTLHEDQQPTVAASTGVQRHAPVDTTAPARPPFRWRSLIPFAMLVWLGGFVATLLPILIGRIALWRFGRSAQILSAGLWTQEYEEARGLIRLRRHVRLLKADADNMPMAWGILHPNIALPSADKWAPEERRAVLLHELAHVKRWDMLTQTIAHVACALYWFNPLVWLARRRMTADRESACDDLVLRAGVRPSLYAEQLLAVARDLRANSFHAAAIAMARPSKLAGRVEAVLNDRQPRRLTAKLLCLCLPIILASVVAVAATATPAQGAPIPLETLKENFRADPGGQNTVALMNVIALRDLSKEEGDEILRLLTQPQLIARSSYSEGKPIVIRLSDLITKGSASTFPGYEWEYVASATVNGKDIGNCRQTRNGSSGKGHVDSDRIDVSPQPIGQHNLSVQVEWKLWPLEGKRIKNPYIRPDWDGPRPNDTLVLEGTADKTATPRYSVKFDLPLVINVVPKGEEEQVALVTNQKLDAAVRKVLQFEKVPCYVGGDDYEVRSSHCLKAGPAPVDLVLNWQLVNGEGKPYKSENTDPIIIRSGHERSFGLMTPAPLSQYPLGLNRCKLIFTPDPEAAISEPDIKEIWGGTIEIPVEFTVSKIAPPKASEQPKNAAEKAPVEIRVIPPPGAAIPENGEMSFEVVSLPLNPDPDVHRRWSSSGSTTAPWKSRSFDMRWGRLYAYVRIVGFAPTLVGPIEHTPEAPCKQLDVPLKPGHTAELRLIPDEGATPDKGNVEIRLSKINGQNLGHPISFWGGHGDFPVGNQGRVIITDLPDDAVASVAMRLDGFEENTVRNIHLDPAKPAEITLKRAVPATGRLFDADGKPLRNVAVNFLGSRGPDGHMGESHSGSGPTWTGTEANGSFSLNSLRGGGWRYWFLINDTRCEGKIIGPVAAGDNLGDITMGHPLVLSGQVVSPTGKVSGIQIQQSHVAGFGHPRLDVYPDIRETDLGKSFEVKSGLRRELVTIEVWFESPRPQNTLTAVPGKCPDGKVTRYLDPETGTVIQLDYEVDLKDSLTGLYITPEGVEIKP